MSGKSIVVLATLDTKGHEAQYMREQIEAMGHEALIVDTGVVGTPATKADVTREEVAEAGGTPLKQQGTCHCGDGRHSGHNSLDESHARPALRFS